MSETARKTALIQFLQKHIGRTLTRNDITYTTTGSEGVFESCVTLHCLDEESFRGTLGITEKEAEHNAAHVALTKHAREVANMPVKTKPSKPSRRGGKDTSSKPLLIESVPKTDLIRFLQKFISRTLTAADTEYSVVQIGEQFQATLILVCLDAECYVGDPCANAKLAEHSAAQKALDTHSADVLALSAPGSAPVRKVAPGRLGHGHGSARAPAQERRAVGGLTFALPSSIAPSSRPSQQKRPPAPAGAKGSAAGSHKTKLIQFLQSYVGRTLTKDDVVYQVADKGGNRTASVTLRCLDGRQFVGGLGEDDKTAEQNAAAVALQDFHADVAAWEAMPHKEKKPRPQKSRRVN